MDGDASASSSSSCSSSLMVAEERITTKFSGLVGAHGTEEEATFLATQQVDEARHMQFYARFQDEVSPTPAAIAAHVERAREQVSDAFRHIFDVALVEAHEQLVAAPGGPRREGPLRHALPPGPRGHARADDVQVHHRLPRATRACCRASSRATRRSTTTRPATSATASGSCARPSATHPEHGRRRPRRRCASCCPPSPSRSSRPDDGDGTDASLGVTEDDIRAFALGGLTRRLEIIGVPLETL